MAFFFKHEQRPLHKARQVKSDHRSDSPAETRAGIKEKLQCYMSECSSQLLLPAEGFGCWVVCTQYWCHLGVFDTFVLACCECRCLYWADVALAVFVSAAVSVLDALWLLKIKVASISPSSVLLLTVHQACRYSLMYKQNTIEKLACISNRSMLFV